MRWYAMYREYAVAAQLQLPYQMRPSSGRWGRLVWGRRGISQSFLCGVGGGHGSISPGEGLGLGLA